MVRVWTVRGIPAEGRWFVVLTLTLTLALALGLGAFVAPAAVAAPVEHRVPMTDIGAADDIPLRPGGEQLQLTIPVPDGMTAEELTTRLELPADLREGWVEVRDRDRRLARLELRGDQIEEGVELRVPLAGVPVEDRAIGLTVSARYLPVDDHCYDMDRFGPLRLLETAVGYSGAGAVPQTVAEFFPPLLQTLIVQVPDELSAQMRSAAVALSTAVVHRYGAQPVDVQVIDQHADIGPETAQDPFTRIVALRETDDGAVRTDLTVGPHDRPVLQIAGGADDLSGQVGLLVGGFPAYAQTSAALGATGFPVPELPGDAVTLDELGVAPLRATGLQHIVLPLEIGQPLLGRPVADLRLRLRGGYVPLPADREGVITVAIGEQDLAAVPMDADGRFSFDVDVPAAQLRRDMTITLAATVAGRFECGVSSETSIGLDGASTIESVRARTPLPGGFRSLPQTLLPQVDVVTMTGDLPDLQRAVAVLTGLQRLSPRPLAPTVRDLDAVLDSGHPAVVIAADGGLGVVLDLPSETADPVLLSQQGLDPGVPFGSAQVLRRGGATMLVLTSAESTVGPADQAGDPADLDRLLAEAQTFGGIGEAEGDVLFAPRGAPLFAVDTDPPSMEEPAGTALSGVVAGWIAAAAVVVLFGAAVGGWAWRRSRKTRP